MTILLKPNFSPFNPKNLKKEDYSIFLAIDKLVFNDMIDDAHST
jgi:hypothetical protein